MGSIEFLTTIFLVFRLYVLVRTNDWQTCPFSPDCVCSERFRNGFVNVNCSAAEGWPKFNESKHQYRVWRTLILTGDVSTIPVDGLATFNLIFSLLLIQTGSRKSVQWDEAAFKNVVVRYLEITNLAGVIPPPAALKPLNDNRFQIKFINVGEKIRLESNAFEDFTRVFNLEIENTEITHIDDDAFVGLDLMFLTLQSASLSSFPLKALVPLKELEFLYLSGNRFSGGELPGLPHLPPSVTSFSIDHNSLTSIPKNLLANSPQLEFLSIGYNNISSVDSTEFEYKTGLESLWLSGNPITNIDLRFGPTSVSTVYLQDTKLQSIDLGVFSGTNLARLYLSDTPTLERVKISTALPSLFELQMDNTGLKHIDPSIDTIFNGYKFYKLSLKNNKNLICDEGIHWLAERLFCNQPYKKGMMSEFKDLFEFKKVFVEGSVCSNKESMPLDEYLRKNVKNPCKVRIQKF